MQEDKDPSKGKGDDKGNDEKKLKAPSSPKSRSPSPKSHSPKMAQLAVPDEQEIFLKVSKKSDSNISDLGLQTPYVTEKSGNEKNKAAVADAERPETPENLRPISELAIHGSLKFHPPSPKPVLLGNSQRTRETKFRPVEQTDPPLFSKSSPRKETSELPVTRDIPELFSPTEDSSRIVPQLPLKISSVTEQFADTEEEYPALIPKQLAQSSRPTKEPSSKHNTSGAEQESQSTNTLIPKRFLRQSPNPNKRILRWKRSWSSNPSKISHKPFYVQLLSELSFRISSNGEDQSDNAEQRKDGSLCGAHYTEHHVDRSSRSPHGSSINEHPSHKSSEFDESLALCQSQQSSRSALRRERKSSNTVQDSEMGASVSKAQAGPVDLDRQAGAIPKRGITSNQNDSSSDDEFFRKSNLERMDKMRSLKQSSRSVWERERTSSSNVPDSEIEASGSTDSVYSVFESETQESSLTSEMYEAQDSLVDVGQEREIFEQGRSPNQTDSSTEDEFFNKENLESICRFRRRSK